MKKLLLTAAALFAFAVSAQAGPTVHKDVIGSWCRHTDENTYISLLPGEEKNCGDGIVVIKSNLYQGWEHECRYTAVKTWFDRSIIATTKTMGVTVSRVDASCEGEGCTWREQLTFYKAQGTLTIRNPRHYRERCK
jgi:hypothetical protein